MQQPRTWHPDLSPAAPCEVAQCLLLPYQLEQSLQGASCFSPRPQRAPSYQAHHSRCACLAQLQ
ncbi:hypothetical protein HaLaN_05401, partial [Haematococcus lacustris]